MNFSDFDSQIDTNIKPSPLANRSKQFRRNIWIISFPHLLSLLVIFFTENTTFAYDTKFSTQSTTSALWQEERKSNLQTLNSKKLEIPTKKILNTVVGKSNSAQSILNKHMQAMGGWSAWRPIESVRFRGIVKNNSGSYDIFIIKKRPNFVRATVTLQQNDTNGESFQLIRGYDGANGWYANRLSGEIGLHKEILDPHAARMIASDSNVQPLMAQLTEDGATLKVSHLVDFEGTLAFELSATHPLTKTNHNIYIDAESYKMVGFESWHGDNRTMTWIHEYKTVNGVLVPSLTTTISDEGDPTVLYMDSIQIGVGVHNEYFSSNT